ncbi:uncharacterized protein A4U43_C07F39660 [Asparagus officinalis]|uniref:VAL1-3 N-terminal zinc finger domain-containing protein n=1 Tax=Asparagus officinalis TaxID=4686 RepID=A0A5P1EKH2_ASPOF|nr:uncharacterized protein A4U43_C07F39660 [Asparagus officinalis]
MSSSSSTMPSAASVKICFNSDCGDPTSEPNCSSSSSRKGWKLRSGDYAHLCDPCSYLLPSTADVRNICVYEKGTFCETFHLDAAGWRKCESCGKRVHCGCIVSAPSYLLLDAGGIECIVCAKKSFSMIWVTSPNMNHGNGPKAGQIDTAVKGQ